MMAASEKGIRLWTANKIPFEPFDFHPAKKYILKAMNEIEKHSVIWFCKRGNEPNYIYFTNDTNEGNFSGTVGTGLVKMVSGGIILPSEIHTLVYAWRVVLLSIIIIII
jgi:hypothetical protein